MPAADIGFAVGIIVGTVLAIAYLLRRPYQ